MHIVAKRRMGFTSKRVYRLREPHAWKYLSEKATFWVAVLSIFAFVTGNMVGQHGWYAFWKSVMGKEEEVVIAFTGTVPPVALVPDVERWANVGGDPRSHTFRQVPKDMLVPPPVYKRHSASDANADKNLQQVYFVEHLGGYSDGRGDGSHPGVDISAPTGTPVQSVANGLVTVVGNDVGGFGNYIVIKHPHVPDPAKGGQTTLYSVYAHLSAVTVTQGIVVRKGEEIGLTGQTGFATGPHLHFQMDRAEAPWHPYWLFSGTEARAAGMSLATAVDKGLNRERGFTYTVDPMLFVQANANAENIRVVTAPSATPSNRPSTVADRKAARLARLAALPTPAPVLVAVADDAAAPAPNGVPATGPGSAASVPAVSSAASSAAPVSAILAGVRIAHDGNYTKDRAWEKIKITLLDDHGETITMTQDTRKLYLTTAFGKAEFKPAVLTSRDFRNGVATVEMLPLGEQTVVVQIQPLGSVSQPMRYLR